MPREYKHYELRHARHPIKGRALASSVIVTEPDGSRTVCAIDFSDKLVEAAGKKLPRGVSLSDPAYLEVTHRLGKWDVEAVYVLGSHRALLWKADTRPSWLKPQRRATHAHHHPAQANDSSPRGGD